MQRRQLPYLDVRSDFLVYVTNVPSALTGKELKSHINAQYGMVKFIETFEAWARRRIGCIVIEFTTFDGSDAFMRAAIERRIPYLGDVGVQHVGIVGRRHFFELIHRDTDIDLLDCNGQPFDTNWARAKRERAQLSKPYNKPFNRGPKPKADGNIGTKIGGGQGVGNDNLRANRHNSPSSDESVGPFPSSSGALRKLIKFSVWQSKTTGRTHILTFDSPEKKINKITPRVKSADIISTKRSLINANKIGGADKNKFDQNQIISERLDRLRAKYDKEASNKIVGEPGGCFIPLASKRRNSVVRPKKPSAAVLPMKMGFEDLEDGEIPDEENMEDGELGEEPMDLCSDQDDDKKTLIKQKIEVRPVNSHPKILMTKSSVKSTTKKDINKSNKLPRQSNEEKKPKTEDKSPLKQQKNSNDSGNYSWEDDCLDFDFPFELVEGDCSPPPKKSTDVTSNSASMDLVSNKSENKPKENNNSSDDGAIDDDDDILEGESIASDIDERCLDDNYGADRSPSAGCGKTQIKSASINEPSSKFAKIGGISDGEGTTTKIDNIQQRCSATTTGLEHSILRMSIGRKEETSRCLN
uniref:RRM domain-containing protein n=1 Tax=Meloidogyne incognita TaxID=6306 RepID=A0A914MIC1_MELIC